MPIHYLTAEELDYLYGMFEDDNDRGHTTTDQDFEDAFRPVDTFGPGFVSIEEATSDYSERIA